MRSFFLVLLSMVCFSIQNYAQVLTSEDSLAAGLIAKDQATVISGYGEARYTYDIKRVTSEATLKRVVLFVGHKFNNRVSLFTELELEDALVTGGDGDEGSGIGGTISMEQAFVKFDINPTTYLVGGLFIPRLGIINENHLPTTFNGNDRPIVEQLVLPSTWRGIGVGIYGTIKSVQGLNYNVSLTNGLNSEGFSNGSGIRNGRQQGSKTVGLNLATTASLLYYVNNFRIQVAGYIGGSTGEEKRVADSLQLDSGPFANPVEIGEANIQYSSGPVTLKALAAYVNIPKALEINRAYANNTPNSIFGSYAEAAYNLLYAKYKTSKALNVFGRYEYVNLSNSTPKNGVENDANRQQYIVGGITFKPVRGVSVKADYTHRITGEPNPALIITPFPQQVPYYTSSGFINIGVAYNF
jgi:hypothetical protein